jgi:sporulation protein YlmC with PRC-barrel domain
MRNRRVHLEHLLGRSVRDSDGCKVGRIEEVEAEETDEGCRVTKFVLGEAGFLKRLSIRAIGPLFIRSLAAKGKESRRDVPWQKIDLSNPKRPKLRCRKAGL